MTRVEQLIDSIRQIGNEDQFSAIDIEDIIKQYANDFARKAIEKASAEILSGIHTGNPINIDDIKLPEHE